MAAPVPLHADRGDGRTYTAPARRPTGQTSTYGRLTIGHFKLHLDLHHLDGMDGPRTSFGPGWEELLTRGKSTMPTIIGLDLAKQVFQVHGVDDVGTMVLRKRLRRSEVTRFLAALSPCLVGIEACGSGDHWARELRRFGHNVRLMPPQYVRPYVKTNEHD